MPTSLSGKLMAGGAWVLAGKLLTVTANLLVQALLARLLPMRVYGAYVVAFSVVAVAAMLAQLGLQHAVVRLVAESMGAGRRGLAAGAVRQVYAYAVLGVVGVCLALTGGGGAWLARHVWNTPLLAASMGALSGWVAAQSLQVLTSETFRGFKDLGRASLFGGVITGWVTVAVLVVLWWRDLAVTLHDVLVLSAAAAGASLLLGLVSLRRKVDRLGRAQSWPAGRIFSIAVPLWVNGIMAYVMFHSAIWILAAFRSKDEVAVYGAAARLVALVSLPLLLVNLVVPPFVAEMYSSGDRRRLQRVLRSTAGLAGLPAFGVLLSFLLAGGTILATVYTEDYRAGASVLALISFGALVNVFTGSCGVTLSMTGHQTTMMAITVVAAAASVAGSMLLVSRFGAIGVASMVCAGTVAQNVLLWLGTRYLTGMWTHVGLPRPAEVRTVLGRGTGTLG